MMNGSNYLQVRPDRRDHVSREQLLCRVRAEFEEMRCLRLTRNQAQRLFGLRPDVCDRVLATLVNEQTLCRESDEQYRYDDHSVRRPAAATNDRMKHYRSQAS